MKIACSGSAFRGQLKDALYNISNTGIGYVDLICINGWDHIILSRLADDFEKTASDVKRMLEEYSLKPAAMNIAVAHPYIRDAEVVEQRKKELKAAAALMVKLGIKVASFYPGYKNDEMPRSQLMDNTVQTIYEMLSIGKESGVSFVIEPHFSTPFQTISQIKELLAAVPELPVAYDPSHFALQGIELSDTEFMLDRTVHVHLRDAAPGKMQSPTGMGTVNFNWIIDSLKDRKYSGFTSIEILSGDDIDHLKEIGKLKALLSGIIQEG